MFLSGEIFLPARMFRLIGSSLRQIPAISLLARPDSPDTPSLFYYIHTNGKEIFEDYTKEGDSKYK